MTWTGPSAAPHAPSVGCVQLVGCMCAGAPASCASAGAGAGIEPVTSGCFKAISNHSVNWPQRGEDLNKAILFTSEVKYRRGERRGVLAAAEIEPARNAAPDRAGVDNALEPERVRARR